MRLAAKEETLFPLAAVVSLAENSRLGFQLLTAALHPGFALAISNTAIEFDASLYDFCIGPRSSGYFRDAETGLDYADQRYHQPGMGRFMTPDPYMNSAGPRSPGSWNRYAYTRGDPVNRTDHSGTDDDECGAFGGSDCGDGVGGYGNSVLDSYNGYSVQTNCDVYAMAYGLASSPAPNPGSGYCSLGLVPYLAVVNGTQQQQQPTCSISLYERPVVGSAVHTYIDATITIGGVTSEEIIDGGPVASLPLSGIFGNLYGWVNSGNVGHYATDNPYLASNQELGSPYTGSNACNDIIQMVSETNSYDAGHLAAYNPVPTFNSPGWNSNSFTYTLLNSVGLAFSFGSSQSWTPGWGYSVPGLTGYFPN